MSGIRRRKSGECSLIEAMRFSSVETSSQATLVAKKVRTGPEVEASINERSTAATSRLVPTVEAGSVSVENGTVILDVSSVTAVIAGIWK